MADAMVKYHCNYCQEDITGMRVKCAECTDFDLCLQCFSCGAEIGPHKNNHSYQLIQDGGSFSVFQPPNAWTAKEELTLLDAIEQYGFGNWEDIADHIDTRNADETQDHYNNMYILGNTGKATLTLELSAKTKDHTCPDGGPLSPSLSTTFQPIELSIQEQQELGYMPYRDDFEREFDNDAETLVSGLVMNYEDEDIDTDYVLFTALKLAHVDMYIRKLKERQRRKRIAHEYGLVASFFSMTTTKKNQTAKKKLSKEEKECQEKMRVFAQFQSSAEHDLFFENIQKEKELKSRIKELMRFRRNGITKLEECVEFETARYKREKKKENKKKSGSSGSSSRRTSMASKKAEERNDVATEELGDMEDEKPELDMTTLPGYELLSEREKKLCSSIGMKPAHYITLKTVLIKDHIQRRQGIPIKTRFPSSLDKNHRRRIINFLTDSGWISSC